jgi:hypothetical protein
MWFLGSLILSILVPSLLSAIDVESNLVWYILAPGWKLFPFGFDDFPQMILALCIDVIIYVAVTHVFFYLVVKIVRRKRYS